MAMIIVRRQKAVSRDTPPRAGVFERLGSLAHHTPSPRKDQRQYRDFAGAIQKGPTVPAPEDFHIPI
jgi:hypothetical protein